VGAGGRNNQALYAHMNNKRKMKKKVNRKYSRMTGINTLLKDNNHKVCSQTITQA
jgi:hypothetical protein